MAWKACDVIDRIYESTDGIPPSEACCECGWNGVTPDDTTDTTDDPECKDEEGWHNGGNQDFTCAVYKARPRYCRQVGNDAPGPNPKNGKTANEACAICRLGEDSFTRKCKDSNNDRPLRSRLIQGAPPDDDFLESYLEAGYEAALAEQQETSTNSEATASGL